MNEIFSDGLPPREEIFLTTADGTIEGYIEESAGSLMAKLEHIEVDESVRLQGEGTELARMFGRRATEMGAATPETIAVEPAIGKIMGKVFGKDNLVLTINGDEDPATQTLLDYETAMAILGKMDQEAASYAEDEDIPDSQRTGIRIGVDLRTDDVQRELSVNPQ
jgi:hypothetical protein